MSLSEGVERGKEVGADVEGDEGLGDLVPDEAGLANAGEDKNGNTLCGDWVAGEGGLVKFVY
ncbi:hypothetical protein Pyn_23003 [Prunus yedoensis var. nudiflora]|uniref:Uncharacterized protein n=1 Tax=Prunus yedoensis var. nudiflora TaxID=2094558 RepID=A0A314YIC1_PRUYE|nr:hypothetical protein Pyn_23003 [Prunus yedoensis var. nudiflora]